MTEMRTDITKKTALYELHQAAGARFTTFAGWEMPVQYSGVIDEHQTVRKAVGLFDVSHMGEVFVKGPEARKALSYLCSNNIHKLVIGHAQYNLLLNHDGGVVDDIIVYCLGDDDFMVCVNAANTDKDFKWMTEQNNTNAKIINRSPELGQLALQGPKAELLLTALFDAEEGDLSTDRLPYFSFIQKNFGTVPLIIARTGYTGEDGFELFFPVEASALIWDVLNEVGAHFGLKPIGLGARDTLRLEAALPLYGHELRADIPAAASNVSWAIKLDHGDFIGQEAVRNLKQKGVRHRLVGFDVVDRGILREGMKIFSSNNENCGWVTSGTFSPTLNQAICLAYLTTEATDPEPELYGEMRGKLLKLKHRELPFYRRKAL